MEIEVIVRIFVHLTISDSPTSDSAVDPPLRQVVGTKAMFRENEVSKTD